MAKAKTKTAAKSSKKSPKTSGEAPSKKAATKASAAKTSSAAKKAAPKAGSKKAASRASGLATSMRKATKDVVKKLKSIAKVGSPAKKEKTVYKLKVGDSAPDVKVAGTSGKTLSLKDFKGKNVVLYFYPKDNTPGCTLEGHDFRRLHKAFQDANCEILGVSKDSVKSHEGFKSKCGFPFELLADENGELCKAFDVIQMKSLYGRKFEGIERSTFVIGRDGKVKAEWRKVKVGGHADEVLGVVKAQA